MTKFFDQFPKREFLDILIKKYFHLQTSLGHVKCNIDNTLEISAKN